MKLISNDLRDGDKLPHRHVFNGMSPATTRMRQPAPAGGTG